MSDVFALPDWQKNAGVPARAGGGTGCGVPDVAADPQTAYQVFVDREPVVIGATSAVAPLWAGLIARIAQLSSSRLRLAQTA